MASPTFQATTDSGALDVTSLSLTVNAGWSVGDLVLAYICGGGRTVDAAPSDWTLIDSNTAVANCQTYVYRRILGSGDPGTSYTWTLSGPAYQGRLVYCRVTGHNSTASVDTSADANDGSAVTSHPSPVLTTGQSDCLLVRFMTGHWSTTTTASSGNTGTSQLNTDSGQGHSIWSYAWSGSGAEASAATYSTGANSRQLAYVSVAVAPAASSAVRSPLIRGDLTYPSTLVRGRLILA
jgi:hypothetical protein